MEKRYIVIHSTKGIVGNNLTEFERSQVKQKLPNNQIAEFEMQNWTAEEIKSAKEKLIMAYFKN